MKEDCLNNSGFVYTKEGRVVYSQNDYFFTFLRPITWFDENSKNTDELIIKDDFAYGITSNNNQIAIFAKGFNYNLYNKNSLKTPLYVISDYNIEKEPINTFNSISFFNGAVTDVVDNKLISLKKPYSLKKSQMKEIILNNETKIQILYGMSISEKIIIKSTVLKFIYNDYKNLSDFPMLYRRACKFLSLLVFYRNPSFEKIKISKDDRYTSTVYFETDEYPQNHNIGSIKIEEYVTKIRNYYNMIIDDEIYNNKIPKFSLLHTFESKKSGITVYNVKDICTALEIELANQQYIFKLSNNRIDKFKKKINKIIDKDKSLFSTSELSNIKLSMNYWGMGLKDKIVVLANLYSDELKSFCEKFRIDLFLNDLIHKEFIDEFINFRNKTTHPGKAFFTSQIIDTSLAMRALIQISLLHRIGFKKKDIEKILYNQIFII